MDENAGFEARPVLTPRRARRSRLALLLPVVTFVAFAWAGISGPHGNQAPAETAAPAAIGAQSPGGVASTPAVARLPRPAPATVVGLEVRRLDEVEPRSLGRDELIAVVGWYVATSITDCPPLASLYRDVTVPGASSGAYGWAYCRRTGVLYTSPPDVRESPAGSGHIGVVRATIVRDVLMPPELEIIGARATQVVVVGHFVGAGAGCAAADGCDPALMVDYIGWTPGS
jgi:hypothetical protein